MKKYLIAVAAALALGFLTHAAEATPSAIPGQACDVNWVHGACGPLFHRIGKAEKFPDSPCNRHDPCDCNKEEHAS